MIRTSMQLKAKVRNLSNGNSEKAQMLIRNYMMERLLERISVSEYGDRFILKGGMLVASMAGLDLRATIDIDTTIRAIPLNASEIEKILFEITHIQIDDNVTFEIDSLNTIMDDFDYPGIRVSLTAHLDNLKQSIKIDISTDDVITPAAVEREYYLMFEKRSIRLMSYPVETVFAEKMETIIARGLANTRMRDFYDLYIINRLQVNCIDWDIFKAALSATSAKRKTLDKVMEAQEILDMVQNSKTMEEQWNHYCNSSAYVGDISWNEVTDNVKTIYKFFI